MEVLNISLSQRSTKAILRKTALAGKRVETNIHNDRHFFS